MGMSEQPMSRAFLASSHAGRVTPAEESITTAGVSPVAAIAPGTSSFMPRTSMSSPASVKPVAHQISLSAPAHAVRISSAPAVARSSSRHATAAGSTEAALSPSRTSAVTECPLFSRLSTTSRPVRPVAPVTATLYAADEQRSASM